MNKFTKILFWLATGIGLVSLVVLIVLQVREPSQVQAESDRGEKTLAQRSSDPRKNISPNYDIEGLYIGINAKDIHKLVNKKYSCETHKMSYDYEIVCKSGREKLIVKLDYKQNAYLISKAIEFTAQPDWSKIKEQLVEKLGSQYIEAYQYNFGTVEASWRSICWGQCEKSGVDNNARNYRKGEFVSINGRNAIQAMLSLSRRSDYSSGKVLDILMRDDEMYQMSKKWYKEEEKAMEERNKEAESRINF